MPFHEKCGSLLLPQKNKNENSDKSVVYFCPKCKEVTDDFKALMRDTNATLKIKIQKQETIVLTNKIDGTDLVKHNCGQCGNDTAFQSVKPPIYGDEDDLIMYKCSKCGTVSRDSGNRIS